MYLQNDKIAANSVKILFENEGEVFSGYKN